MSKLSARQKAIQADREERRAQALAFIRSHPEGLPAQLFDMRLLIQERKAGLIRIDRPTTKRVNWTVFPGPVNPGDGND